MKSWSNSDAVATSQYIPEKRLLAAVLQRAITDFISGDGEVRESAGAWLMDDDNDEESPLTFLFICEALDLDCDGLRKAIIMQAKAAAMLGANGIGAETGLLSAAVQ